MSTVDRSFSEDDHRFILDLRGGCTCFLSAPCSACFDYPDDDEIELLDDQNAVMREAAEEAELAEILRVSKAVW